MNKTHAFRLMPGADLRAGIEAYVKSHGIEAGWIGCGVGSLSKYNIRFANQPDGSSADGHFEIVSLTGTVSVNGSHIHVSISDNSGRTIGGHLVEGSIVYTTAEIIIQEPEGLVFSRAKDGSTPWEELQINRKE